MTIDCMIEDKRWVAVGLADLSGKAVKSALRHLGLDPKGYEISILACNDARIASLNADFRGKPQPTNVLSWPSEERGADAPGAAPQLPIGTALAPVELGDIAIAYDTCAAEAAAAGLTFADHITHLIVHATLHLLGFDHERDGDATLMEGIETAILGKMQIADPYSEKP